MSDKIWQWIGDYCSGCLSREDERALRKWVESSEGNKRYFSECVKTVREYQVASLGEVDKATFLKEVKKRIRMHEKRRRRMWWCGAAAAVLVAAGVSLALYSQRETAEHLPLATVIEAGSTKATLELENGEQIDLMQENLESVIASRGVFVAEEEGEGVTYETKDTVKRETEWHTISVPVGGEYHFTLADGTMVWLNSASRVTFPTRFDGERREVYMEGEGYFEVEHRDGQPFVVHARKTSVEVLGTKFCVTAYPESQRIMTTLVEGAVNVTAGESGVVLSPGHQAVVDTLTGMVTRREVTPSVYTSWIKGIIEYEDMSLEEIAAQLSRWYSVEFSFASPDVEERRFTGVARKDADLVSVLHMIEQTTNVRFVVQDRKVFVTSVEK